MTEGRIMAAMSERSPPLLMSARQTAFFTAALLLLSFLIAELKAWSLRRGGSKLDIEVMTVQAYARHAYPLWHAAHPDHACPGSIDELNPYMPHSDSKDSWGSPYELHCGAKGIIVHSRGEDAVPNTADDLWSHP